MDQFLDRAHRRPQITPAFFFVLLVLFFFLPVIVVPLLSLLPVAWGELSTLQGGLPAYLLASLRFSFFQASLSTFLSALIGGGIAFFLIENGKGARSLWWQFSLLPFSLPSLIVVLALLSFWGNAGVGLSLFGVKGIVLCHVVMNFPLFLRIVGESWMAQGTEEECAALSLGASRLQTFCSVSFPKIKASLFRAALLCFTFCFCSFIPVAVLGGDPKFSTFELNIYQAMKFENNLPKAAFLSFLQGLILFPLFFLFSSTERREKPVATKSRLNLYRLEGKTKMIGTGLCILLLLSLTFGPLLMLLIKSLWYLDELKPNEFLEALGNSLTLASYCTLLVLPVAFAAAYLDFQKIRFSRGIGWFMTLPLFIPVMLLTAALSQTFSFAFDFFRSSFWGVALIQSVIALPLAFRVLLSGFDSFPEEITRAAASLGASSWQVLFYIHFPLLARFVIVAVSFVFCFSLGEVSALLLFGSYQGPTLSLLVFQKLGKYAVEEAFLYGAVIMVLMSLILWSLEKWKRFSK